VDMHRLIELTLAVDGTVDERMLQVIADMKRSQLKEYLSGLRRVLRARRVEVAVSGEPGDAGRRELTRAFTGRELVVTADEGLGGGMKVSAGDDVLDASVRGILRATLEKLGKS
jgi:F0F1-type ATP synthase delta subunit